VLNSPSHAWKLLCFASPKTRAGAVFQRIACNNQRAMVTLAINKYKITAFNSPIKTKGSERIQFPGANLRCGLVMGKRFGRLAAVGSTAMMAKHQRSGLPDVIAVSWPNF
jgi:hypothetical protein